MRRHPWHIGGQSIWDRRLIRAPRFTEPAFRPYLNGIGKVVVTWNSLHLAIGKLFQNITETRSGIAQQVWYSIRVDRGARDMVLAALDAHQWSGPGLSKNQVEDIK